MSVLRQTATSTLTELTQRRGPANAASLRTYASYGPAKRRSSPLKPSRRLLANSSTRPKTKEELHHTRQKACPFPAHHFFRISQFGRLGCPMDYPLRKRTSPAARQHSRRPRSHAENAPHERPRTSTPKPMISLRESNMEARRQNEKLRSGVPKSADKIHEIQGDRTTQGFVVPKRVRARIQRYEGTGWFGKKPATSESDSAPKTPNPKTPVRGIRYENKPANPPPGLYSGEGFQGTGPESDHRDAAPHPAGPKISPGFPSSKNAAKRRSAEKSNAKSARDSKPSPGGMTFNTSTSQPSPNSIAIPRRSPIDQP